MQHVMVDLETMSTRNYAAILSIGAVKFDPENPGFEPDDKFYCAVSLSSNQELGLHFDAKTIEWWMHNDRNAARVKMMAEDKRALSDVLSGFAEWFGQESLPLWGNGATFDNVILRNAFSVAKVRCPWDHWHDRCYRTIKNLCPSMKMEMISTGAAHHALDDAHAQMIHLKLLSSRLGITLS